MQCYRGRILPIFVAFGSLFLGLTGAQAADPEIDRLLRSPIGKDWVTNGGNLTNQRYSTLKQIDTTNVKQLKGAWMTRLKGSGLGGKYSLEASPLVKDGIMYVVTGNDDVFALDAKTGAIMWEYWSGIDQKISTVCCGWVNRGLAMGEGLLFLGQLDANVVALDPAHRARRQDRCDPVAVVHVAGSRRGRERHLAGGHRPCDARWRHDLEHASARSRARPCLLRGRQLRTGL